MGTIKILIKYNETLIPKERYKTMITIKGTEENNKGLPMPLATITKEKKKR